MSGKLFKINDKISVQCEYYENSRHWGHRAELYFYDRYIGKTTITYYNRTWEAYEFQSVLRQIANKNELTKEEDDWRNFCRGIPSVRRNWLDSPACLATAISRLSPH